MTATQGCQAKDRCPRQLFNICGCETTRNFGQAIGNIFSHLCGDKVNVKCLNASFFLQQSKLSTFVRRHPATSCLSMFLAGGAQITQLSASHGRQGCSASLNTRLQQLLNGTCEPLAGSTRGCCGPDIWLGGNHTHWTDATGSVCSVPTLNDGLNDGDVITP